MYYRKKPIIIEAHQWFPAIKKADKPRPREAHGVRFCPANRETIAERGIIVDRPARYVIDTLEGPMEVRPGDWIITGVKGERYACRQDIFAMTHEPLLRTSAEVRRLRSWAKFLTFLRLK